MLDFTVGFLNPNLSRLVAGGEIRDRFSPESASNLQLPLDPKPQHRRTPDPLPLTRRPSSPSPFRGMGLWTFLEGFLLLANALAILNEDRFLAPRGWSFSEVSGGGRAKSLKGQVIADFRLMMRGVQMKIQSGKEETRSLSRLLVHSPQALVLLIEKREKYLVVFISIWRLFVSGDSIQAPVETLQGWMLIEVE
ncbi:hypothetical protein J5N97_014641 [Dioscorea zingiberensis]|uniref:Immediate early response 3-interacting protein 1 n=1 Tax=Dioscorea zingiberensis TaxID=325984 RepID=A0A9D5CV62_9LILI|nr:hypothetical protein J5N97_014641 [Dioscorea zingiberensis]